MDKLSFQVDTRIASLLSENYRSSEKALKELVDNAWDADANVIDVVFPEEMTTDPIVITDDGSGMTLDELEHEYFNIARNRRERRGELTTDKKRKVKGKKGIGKFAGLVAASSMKLETWTRGKKCEFLLNKEDFDTVQDIKKLSVNLSITECSEKLQGTRITLIGLHQHLAFPDPDKFRLLLIQDYGRSEGFKITVNSKALGIDDVSGNYTEYSQTLTLAGNIKLEFTIADQKGKLKQPGISIRVAGKVIGKPSFFGLDKVEDFPPKLLNKIYGEIEVDGLRNHVTADWDALIENSEIYNEVEEFVQPLIKAKVREEYGHDLNRARAKLNRKLHARLAKLPEHKRVYADKAIKAVLRKYYGEPENKLEPIANVILEALERSEYRAVLDYIHEANHSDISKLAEILSEFGIVEIAIVGEQAKSRLEFLNKFEILCSKKETSEKLVHDALEKNMWVFGVEFSLFSSNKTLKKQVEKYLDKSYAGDNAQKRPDLILNQNYANDFLLIEFKRPSHSLKYEDYQQATGYRNDFVPFADSQMNVLLVGGRRGNSLPPEQNREPNVNIKTFEELISNARNQLNWLLKELGADAHF